VDKTNSNKFNWIMKCITPMSKLCGTVCRAVNISDIIVSSWRNNNNAVYREQFYNQYYE